MRKQQRHAAAAHEHGRTSYRYSVTSQSQQNREDFANATSHRPKTPIACRSRRGTLISKLLRTLQRALMSNTIIGYEPAAAGTAANTVFDLRDEHDLIWNDRSVQPVFGGWVEGIPMVDNARGEKETPWPTMAQLTLPFVAVGDDAVNITYGDVYYTEEAWSRWVLAVKEVGGTAASVLSSYGVMYTEVEKLMASATPEIKDRLTLRRADTVPVQSESRKDTAVGDEAQKAAAAAYNLKVDGRDFLRRVKLGMLADAAGRMGNIARLATWLGSHVTRASRDGSAFNRNAAVLRAAISVKEVGTAVGELDDDELAAGLCSALRATERHSALQVLVPEPGGVEVRSAMRREVAAWRDGADMDKLESSLLAEHIATAAPGYPAVRALLGVKQSGMGMSVSATAAFNAVASAALRIGARSAAEPMGMTAMGELSSRGGHLAEMLAAAPWVARSVAERCDHLVVTLQSAARAEQRASQSVVGGVSGDAAPREGDAPPKGTGAVPKRHRCHATHRATVLTVHSSAKPCPAPPASMCLPSRISRLMLHISHLTSHISHIHTCMDVVPVNTHTCPTLLIPCT